MFHHRRTPRLRSLVALGVLFAGSACQSVFLEQRIGPFDVDGDLQTDFSGTSSTNSFTALGTQDSNLEALPSITFESAPSSIVIDYFSRDTVGVGLLEEDIVLSDANIPMGTTVQTEQELTFARLRYLHDLAGSDTHDVAIGLGVAWVAVDIQIDGGFERGTFDEGAPFPVVTAQWALRRGQFEFELDGTYSQFELDDAEADYTSAIASVRWSFLKQPSRAALTLGYRAEALGLDFTTSDNEIIGYDADIDGLFLGLQFAF